MISGSTKGRKKNAPNGANTQTYGYGNLGSEKFVTVQWTVGHTLWNHQIIEYSLSNYPTIGHTLSNDWTIGNTLSNHWTAEHTILNT